MTTAGDHVDHLLAELELLNETKASASFDAKIKGGESAGPQPVDTALDYFRRRLERWLSDVEKRLHEERKGQADEMGQVPDLTPEQKRYYLLHSGDYDGTEYRKAAEALGLDARRVYDMRKQVGLNPRNGRSVKKT